MWDISQGPIDFLLIPILCRHNCDLVQNVRYDSLAVSDDDYMSVFIRNTSLLDRRPYITYAVSLMQVSSRTDNMLLLLC